MEGFSPEELPDTREIISYLQKKLDDTSEHMEVLEIYHAVRQLSYNSYPDNRLYTDFLSNNKGKFNISSYFDVPASPKAVLRKWSLPKQLQGKVILDNKREWVVDQVVKGAPDRNYVIIGEPGVGKIVILFEIFDKLMREENAGLLTSENISDFHSNNRIRLFYDDLPENREMITALKGSDAKGIVVTARLKDWEKKCSGLDSKFTRRSIPDLKNEKEKMVEIIRMLLGLYNIYSSTKATDLLVEYAEGIPIYIWLLIKEMNRIRLKELDVDYLKKNASRGMINYVGDLLHRLLMERGKFKQGVIILLLCFICWPPSSRRKSAIPSFSTPSPKAWTSTPRSTSGLILTPIPRTM